MRREPGDPSEPRSHFRVLPWSRGRPARALRRTKILNRAGARGEQATPLARTWRRRGPGDLYVRRGQERATPRTRRALAEGRGGWVVVEGRGMQSAGAGFKSRAEATRLVFWQ